MMVNTSIEGGAAPVTYVNGTFVAARDRVAGTDVVVFKMTDGKYGKSAVLKVEASGTLKDIIKLSNRPCQGHDMIVKTLLNDGDKIVVSGGWDGKVDFKWQKSFKKGNWESFSM